MTTNECRCGKPTRDAAYVCDSCGHDLAVALGDVTWLDEQLEITITRTSGVDYRTLGGTPSSETPSPVHWAASEARGHLKAILVSWVLFCEAERVRDCSPYPGMPEDNLAALAGWLLWRVDGLCLLDIGTDAVDEITSGVAHCHRLIDRHPERQYLGRCDAPCPGSLYATPGSAWARCQVCDAAIDADTIRKRLLTELDDRLCTSAEIAHLSTYLGLKAGREQVRTRINQWHSRKQIESESMFGDHPAFRFGTVYAMLLASEYAGPASNTRAAV